MKLLTLQLSLFTWLLISNAATAQQTGTRKINTISTWDTLYFSLPFRYAYNDSIPGIGKVILPDISYRIARSGTKVISRKGVGYCNDDCSGFLSAISDWLILKDDSLLTWLDAHVTSVRHEELAPFIYREELAGDVFYEKMWASHPTVFGIGLERADSMTRKSINLDHVKEYMQEGRVKNINYPYNTHTNLYQLYLMLEQRFMAWDLKYTFPKAK